MEPEKVWTIGEVEFWSEEAAEKFLRTPVGWSRFLEKRFNAVASGGFILRNCVFNSKLGSDLQIQL